MKQYEKTGALIASVRKEKGLTQKELAVTLHVSDTTVSKWERGIGFPDVSLVEPLAVALGLTIGELFAGERAAEPLPQECEALLSGVLTESNAQSRRKRREDRIAFAVALGILILIAVPLLFFRAKQPAVLRGTYISPRPEETVTWEEGSESAVITLSRPNVTVQLSAGWPDAAGVGKYTLYLDSRMVEEGTYVANGDGTFTLTGAWADGTPRIFFAEPREDGSFRILLPALDGNRPILLEKVGDVPCYIGTVYGDEAEYRKKYMQPAA